MSGRERVNDTSQVNVANELNINLWNQLVLSDLVRLSRIAEEDGEGCFLVAMQFIKNSFIHQPLPSAEKIWQSLREQYHDILEAESLMVPHNKFGQAFEKYRKFGIKLSSYRLNAVADALIGESMRAGYGLPENPDLILKNKTLSTEGVKFPFCLLVHHSGMCNTHVLADDGSRLTKSLREVFIMKNYRVIAIFTFESENVGKDNFYLGFYPSQLRFK